MLADMLGEREYLAEAPPKPLCRATIAVLAVNGIVWLGQMWAHRHNLDAPVEDYFALSLEGLRHGYLWQLLSFQFLHAVPEPWHLLLNSWAIWVFGRVVEYSIGWRRMLTVYFLSGVAGGLTQMLGSWLLPGLFGDGGVVGASAGAFGLVAAFAVLYPRERIYLLLFFVIPLRMRATTLVWLSIIVAALGIVSPIFDPQLPPVLSFSHFFGNVAHAAHLGGILTGLWYAGRLLRRAPVPLVMVAPPKSSLNATPAGD